jgi:hypothetical protein
MPGYGRVKGNTAGAYQIEHALMQALPKAVVCTKRGGVGLFWEGA